MKNTESIFFHLQSLIDNKEAFIETLQNTMIPKSKIRDLLEKYSNFLSENGYMDDDWKMEPPNAIDEFLKKNSVVKMGLYEAAKYSLESENSTILDFGMTLAEAKDRAYPDGGGKYLIERKYYRVHCDEYHTHRFKCLVEIK